MPASPALVQILTIPYEWYNVDRSYEPDYLVRLGTPRTETMELTVVLEIKGMLTEEDKAKHEAARRWVAAVNNWGKLGRSTFAATRKCWSANCPSCTTIRVCPVGMPWMLRRRKGPVPHGQGGRAASPGRGSGESSCPDHRNARRS
jgi:hypothetical protein